MSAVPLVLRRFALSAAAAVVVASSASAAEGGAQERFQTACASLARGDLPAAQAGFDAALSLDSRYLDAYAQRAVVLSLLGKSAQASVDYYESRKVLGQGGTAAEAAPPCGAVAARELRRLTEAARLAREAKASAIALARQGDKTGARRNLDSALAADPGDPESYQSRAVIREADGDWRGALDDYEKGLLFSARRPDFHQGVLASRDELRLKWREAILADEAVRRDAAEDAARAAAFAAVPRDAMYRFAQIQFALVALLIVWLSGAGILAAWRCRAWQLLPRRELVWFFVCLALALFVRIEARTSPADILLRTQQGLGILNTPQWTAGFSCILHALYLVFPANVSTVAGFNVVIGTLTVALVYAFVTTYFEDRVAAFAAAAVLACQPVSARYAASDSPHVLLTFCLFLACLFIVLWTKHESPALLGQAVGWMVLAANIRIEGIVSVGAVAFVLLGAAGRIERPQAGRLLRAGIAGAVLLVFPITHILMQLSDGKGIFSLFGCFGAFFQSRHSPAVVAGLALLGLAGALRIQPRKACCFFLALAVVSLPTGFLSFNAGNSEVRLRHTLPHLAAWSVFGGCGFSAAIGLLSCSWARIAPTRAAGMARVRQPLFYAAILAVAWAAFLSCRGFLTKTWTYALEYEFIVRHLSSMSDDCLMVAPEADTQHRGLYIVGQLSTEAGRRHRWVPVRELADVPRQRCVVFYRAAACSAWEQGKRDWTGGERPVCRSVREHFDLKPIATAALPALPYAWEVYAEDPVPVGFYRLTPRHVATLHPRRQARGAHREVAL